MGDKFVWMVRSESGKVIGRQSLAAHNNIAEVRPFVTKGATASAMKWAKKYWPSDSWRVVKYKLVEVEE